MLVRMWRKQTLVHCCWECRLVQPLWKTEWNFLKKLKMEMFYVSAILLLGIHLKRPKTLIWKNISTPMFIAALFTTSKIWKQPKCPPIDEWIKKSCSTFTQWNTTRCKKEGNLTPCDSVDGPGECYAKWNKPVGERQTPYDFTYTWNLMNKIN